jgi:hypothetical protein
MACCPGIKDGPSFHGGSIVQYSLEGDSCCKGIVMVGVGQQVALTGLCNLSCPTPACQKFCWYITEPQMVNLKLTWYSVVLKS